MAEVEVTNVNEAENASQTGENSENNPTYDQLLEELAKARAGESQANAERERFKNSVDDLTRKNKMLTDQVRERMTADERASEEVKSRMEALEAENAGFKTKFRIADYSKRFMGVGMDEKTATELAGLTGEIAEPDKFFSTLDKFVKAAMKKAGEDSVQALIKSNPSVKAGNGDGDKESEAVRLAKESAARRQNKGFNEDALKQWM